MGEPTVPQDAGRLRDEIREALPTGLPNAPAEILALPALRRLIAERDEAREANSRYVEAAARTMRERDEARAELRQFVEAVGRGDDVLPPAYRRAVAYVRALDEPQS